jgi:hypothetical protein
MCRLGLLIAVALLVPPAATDAAGTATGLHGAVVSSGRPVCIEGRSCSQPAAGVVLVFRRDGETVARTTTHANGTYRLLLRRGLYRVFVQASRPIARITPSTVRVIPGRMRRIDFELDRGLQ